MAQSKSNDLTQEAQLALENVSKLELKITKIQELIKSGQKVELDDLKALNQALRSANDVGAAW